MTKHVSKDFLDFEETMTQPIPRSLINLIRAFEIFNVRLSSFIVLFDCLDCQFLFTVKKFDYLNFRTSIYLALRPNNKYSSCMFKTYYYKPLTNLSIIFSMQNKHFHV